MDSSFVRDLLILAGAMIVILPLLLLGLSYFLGRGIVLRIMVWVMLLVANEVRQLAEKSAAATREIGGLIRGIQTTVGKAVPAMDAGAREVGLGAVGAADSVSAVMEENTAATEEMAAGSSAVTLAIENIASVSEENSAAVEEVSASAEEMSAQVKAVTAAAQSLAEQAKSLQAVVAQFTLAEGPRGGPKPPARPMAAIFPVAAGRGAGRRQRYADLPKVH